ncbi:hypothetical protein [Chamaesiphon minutus]|uniref:Uncharacterized protein n=1 Tax=Chamaesiphon minutus (strain ATCC 27169 / PCC 6605) TaxID=1173020 RepID=K9URY7_CHAP6|nr:hypothetical protein [Chamaesiphon minutus]AFY97216.1 hypothetical protein Cha6605_6397 [Chamaesiphon minutus PCC 6605]
MLVDFPNITILASTDPAVIADQYQAALNKIIAMFITGDASAMTDTFWAAIVEPCKLIAGIGVLFWLIPILPDLSLDNLKNHLLRILMLLFITFIFINNAYPARVFAIGNYAMIKGIDSAIADNLKLLGNVNADLANLKIDNQKIKAISNQIQTCIKLPKTIADPDPAKPGNVIPNPAYVQCGKDVKTMVVQAKLSINNPEIVKELANTEAKLNAIVDGYDYNSAWNQFVTFVNDPDKWIRNNLFGSILDAWSYVINQSTDESFILSILALPISLAFSFINTKPFEIWFASLWGLGIFKFSLTILSGCVSFMNANLVGGTPVWGMELSYALGAPIIAGIIAKGGGEGLIALMAQVSTELTGLMKPSAK